MFAEEIGVEHWAAIAEQGLMLKLLILRLVTLQALDARRRGPSAPPQNLFSAHDKPHHHHFHNQDLTAQDVKIKQQSRGEPRHSQV